MPPYKFRKLVHWGFKIEESDRDAFYDVAKEAGKQPSTLIREIIHDYVTWWNSGGRDIVIEAEVAKQQSEVVL